MCVCVCVAVEKAVCEALSVRVLSLSVCVCCSCVPVGVVDTQRYLWRLTVEEAVSCAGVSMPSDIYGGWQLKKLFRVCECE